MRNVARLPENDRNELFRATAQRMQVHEAIVEKDFWVCWILDYLFHDSPWKDDLTFKGGTSLSKAFGAIERFSEDIDLILDWGLLEYSEGEVYKERSGKKEGKFREEVDSRLLGFKESVLAPGLEADMCARLGRETKTSLEKTNILVEYPHSFSIEAIRPEVILEIGPRARAVPNELRDISPYAAQKFPGLFRQPSTSVRTVTAERTFWEKATILHEEAQRGEDKSLPARYSRHYYDLYRLSILPIKTRALENLRLLDDVAQFKMKFYRRQWARYEDAKPGTLRLLPPSHHIAELKRDYVQMQAMLFGSIPSFDEIIDGLAALENEINSLVTSK